MVEIMEMEVIGTEVKKKDLWLLLILQYIDIKCITMLWLFI